MRWVFAIFMIGGMGLGMDFLSASDLSSRIRAHLEEVGQGDLFEETVAWSDIEKQAFWKQIETYPSASSGLYRFDETVAITPFSEFDRAGSKSDYTLGKTLIAEGKVACVILAGGQGSRMKLKIPKGMVTLPSDPSKTLFHVFCEKVQKASAQAGRSLHLAIMTSPLNDQQTKEYFDSVAFFGLPRSHCHFFEQGMLPLLDLSDRWILEAPGKVLAGPNGNGYVLHRLYESGLFKKWQADGVEYVSVIVVDNPLADPFDPELIGYHARTQNEVVMKAVMKANAEEKMGVIVRCQGKARVVEYSEMKPSDSIMRDEKGELLFALGNTSLFSFRMDFIRRIAENSSCVLPWHIAQKEAYTPQGAVSVKKYEAFIFDVLNYANSVGVLLYPRQEIFAPLKVLP